MWEGSEMLVPEAERVAPEPGEFYQADLIGCRIESQESTLGADSRESVKLRDRLRMHGNM